MDIHAAINHTILGQDLSRSDMQAVMQQIMTGECDDAQIAGLLVALRIKGETVNEITGAAEVMASLASPVNVNADNAIDIVGTGGDGSGTFNVSSASAFVAAGAGCMVAKHGNRSVSSKSGSADLLEAMGANLELNAEQVGEVITTAGLGFMFAPMHHSAMRHAIGARKSLGTRTLFNVLGPLTNPAKVKHQVVGVFDQSLCKPLAQVFAQLGSKHTLVVHSIDGMDEISVCAATHVCEMRNNECREYQISPEDFGLSEAKLSDLQVAGPDESLAVINDILDGKPGGPRDMVVLNAAAGIYVSGIAESMDTGVRLAQQSIDSGQARRAQQAFVDATQAFTL